MFLSRPVVIALALIIGICQHIAAQNLPIGQWRTHLPYKQGLALAEAGDKIYCLSNVTFFSFDKVSYEVQKYDKVLGLSDIKVIAIDYNKEYDALVVVYDNANIDLIKNNTIINISDIKRKSITGEKRIYNIHFEGPLAYLATSFGIVVMDVDNQEIKDTWYIGDGGTQMAVFDVTLDGTNIYAATSKGVKYAPLNAVNLANYQEWTQEPSLPADSATHIINFHNEVIVNINDTLYRRYQAGWAPFYEQPGWTITHLDQSPTHLLISETDTNYVGRIARFDANMAFASPLTNPEIRLPREVLVDADSTLWLADEINGLVRFQNNVPYRIFVNGPGSSSAVELSAARGKLWMGAGPSKFANAGYNPDQGFAVFQNNLWSYFDQYNRPELADFLMVNEILASPVDDKVYLGALWSGLLIYTPDSIVHYDQTNSILEEQAGNPGRVGVTGLALDADNNLWMSNYRADKTLVVKKADGTWAGFRPSPPVPGNALGQLLVDDNNYIWGRIEGSLSVGILVYNHNNTIDDPTDDESRLLTAGAGRGGLPSGEVRCIAKDLEGEIWVGTAAGIAVFYCPGSIFSDQGCDAQQILVSEGGFNGYLLATEIITVIKVDGANRKWIGTSNGLWLFSADGTQQLAYYNTDNSPLLSNDITSITIDENGEVFVGSLQGIVSLRGEATPAGDEFADECLVFPNPVRENYTGQIAIRGMAENSQVKITDITGTLIYQTTSLGGQAVWNGQDYTGRDAKGGVYLVFATNSDGSASKTCKLLLMR